MFHLQKYKIISQYVCENEAKMSIFAIMKEIKPIAFFHSPFTSKFGIPRQSGLVDGLRGRIVFEPEYNNVEALRGLEDFDYVWLIWGFSANEGKKVSSTVRPPRLGGNERVGVFASRSPFRPNGLGLSSVKIAAVGNGWVDVTGADLMDGTPIYDVKPYVVYADSHPDARSGFTDNRAWKSLDVSVPAEFECLFTSDELESLRGALSLDPRPHYHDDPDRVYGMPFAGRDVRFRVSDGRAVVVGVERL